MTLADRDEVLLVAPSRSFVLEYPKPVEFLRWRRFRTARTSVTLRTLPLRELQQIQRTYIELENRMEFDLTVAMAVLIGPVAFYLSAVQLETLWKAHSELNLIPKEVAAEEKESPTPPSHADLNGGPSSSTETASST